MIWHLLCFYFLGEIYPFFYEHLCLRINLFFSLVFISFFSSFCVNRFSRMFSTLHYLIDCQLKSNMNIEECLRLSEFGLEKRPEWYIFLHYKGVSLHKLGRHEEALTILREAEEKWYEYDKELQKDLQEVERALARQNQ